LEGLGAKDTVTVLGAFDSDPTKSIVGYTTELGKKLLGKKVGEEVDNKGHTMTIKSIELYYKG
jgi:transcription elongation GreA/GreB family factor